jgi:predicted transcriptional regulator of viral defense system
MSQDPYDHILQLTDAVGILRAQDLDAHEIPRVYLQRMVDDGLLERADWGLYVRPDAEVTEHHSLALASRRVPRGVVCLLSALQFHGLTTQLPNQVWMALHPKDHRPRVEAIPLRFVRFSGPALAEGVTVHTIEKVPVPIYAPAKTVADCFKYRNKIGLDIALEALRDCLTRTDSQGQRLCSVDDLWRYAEICRVSGVMQPYLKAMV